MMPQKAPHSSSPESSVPSRLARPAPPPAMLPGTGLPLRLRVTNGGVTARRGGTPTGIWGGQHPAGRVAKLPLVPWYTPYAPAPPVRTRAPAHPPACGRPSCHRRGVWTRGRTPLCTHGRPARTRGNLTGAPVGPPGAAGTDRRWSPLRSTAPPPPPPRLISPQHPVPGSCHLPWGPGTAPGDIGMLLSTWGQ